MSFEVYSYLMHCSDLKGFYLFQGMTLDFFLM